MREFTEVLEERATEIDKHLVFIKELNDHAIGRGDVVGTRTVDVEHINILKSGFLVHLYNIVESVMTKVLEEISICAKAHSPMQWSDGLLKEWARGRAGFDKDIGNDNRLERIYALLAETTGRTQLQTVRVLARPGNWSNEEITNIARLLACDLTIPEAVRVAACDDRFENDLGPMKYVRHKRNRLAHGNESFQSAAAHLTPERLADLKVPVINYLREACVSFERYLDERKFLREVAQ